jgi:hypothetical protein
MSLLPLAFPSAKYATAILWRFRVEEEHAARLLLGVLVPPASHGWHFVVICWPIKS